MPKLKKPSSAEVKELDLNTGGFFYIDSSETALEDAKKTFYDIVNNGSKPYLVDFKELKDLEYIDTDKNNDYSYKTINEYVDTLIRNIELPPHEMDSDISQKEDNWTFHCCKVMWLMHQERTIGLYSTMQGKIGKRNLFIHPGMSRVYATMQMNLWDKKVVVWDYDDVLSEKQSLSFEEWVKIFDVPEKSKFCVNVEGKILEMHVGERRDLIINAEVDIKTDLFKHKKPILKGNATEDIKHLFRDTGDDGVLCETHGNYIFTYDDLRWFTELYPKTKEIYQNDNFTISRL